MEQAYIHNTTPPVNNQTRREIGSEAVWTLSSAKIGNGVQQLRDDNTNTFWQSDGSQPHLINIQFMKKTRVQELCMFFDFKSDESYTPSKISIRAGNNMQDLKEVQYLELKEPTGWYTVPLKTKLLNNTEKNYINTINIQIVILQNQHSGKDTHMRQIKIFGPKEKINQGLGFPDFKAAEITQFYSVRLLQKGLRARGYGKIGGFGLGINFTANGKGIFQPYHIQSAKLWLKPQNQPLLHLGKPIRLLLKPQCLCTPFVQLNLPKRTKIYQKIVISTFNKQSKMIRKKQAEQLEPIKITKTQANYQSLLLDMMSKLVSEQRESNRLLRKMAGENDHEASRANLLKSPSKPIFQALQKSMPLSTNSPQKEAEDECDRSEEGSIICSSPFRYVSDCLKEKEEPSELQVLNEKTDKVVSSLEGLGEILKRIQFSFASAAKQGDMMRSLKRTVTKEFQQRDIRSDSTDNKENVQSILDKLQAKKQDNPVENKKEERQAESKTENYEDPLKDGFNFIDKKDLKDLVKPVKKNKAKRQRQGGRVSAFNTDKIETSLEQIRGVCKLQPALCKQAEEKRNYSIVTHILPYSDKREMKIKISVQQVMEYYNLKLIRDEVQASTVAQHWLGCVYRSTASICWNLLSKHELSFDQTKILFTENIIYNIIEFMRTIKTQERVTGIKANRWRLVENINATSVNILQYLCMQYPQTKVEDANIALRREIPNIDNKGEVEFDLISKVSQTKEVIFRRKESANYTQQIMKTINYMIQRSNQEYPNFKDMFSQIFEEVFRPLHKRRTPMAPEQAHEDHVYAEKVRNYTKYAISQKINKNTPKYTDEQIENGIFFVKSPSVLRVITKWVEELDEIIRNPEHLVKNTQNQFKDHSGLPLYLYAQIKNGLYKEIRRRQKDFEEKVRHIKQECYHMEVLLALENFIADDSQRHISREQTSVGKYCYYLKSAISSYICSELNEAIHFLLSLPEAVDETKIGITDHFYQEESKKDLLNLNLVHFKIFDLLRCKCISKESEIVYLIRRLNQMSNDLNNPFKIIRIKDRLRNGTRDILINAQLGKGLVCEIQLAVVSNIDKKQEQLDQFNHFLYELKRAKLGPVSENAAIWSTLEQRAGYYEGIIGKQEKEVKHSEQPRHPCIQIENSEANTGYAERFTRPIICVSCKTFYEIPRTCLFNITCKRCRQTYCGECHYANMKEAPRKEYIFERYFRPFFSYLQEYTDYSKPFPRFGFLIRKFYLKKQVFFFRVLCKGAEQLAENGRIGIQIIISVVQEGKVRNFAINECPLQAEVRNGDLIITETRHRDEISKYIVFGIDMSKDLLEKKTGPLGEVFQSFSKEKLKYINLLKQPAYIEQIKMIKRSKQLKKEARQLRAVLSDQTLLTYLKLDKIVVLVQIETEEKALNQELVKILNITKLRNYALEKSFAVSMDFRQMTDEMDIIRTGPKEFPKELYDNFCRRVTKFYINFGCIQRVTFLADFTKIRVLYLSSNCITSLEGIENLTMLEYVCFDKNSVSSLEPLANLTNLVQISGSENRITSLDGLQGLSKMTILTLYKNEISQIKCLDNMQLRELSLNNNPIQKLANLSHMKDSMEELYIGGTKFHNFDGIYEFSGLRKLSLDSMNLKKISPSLLKGLQALTHLSLADNQLDKIQNLQSQGSQLVQLNLKNNYIREISGLEGCSKLEILKLQHNFISNVAGIKGIERLKVLYLQENPLQDCSDLYSTENNIELYFTKQEDSANCDPLYAPKPCFYEKYENYEKERGASSSNNDQQVEDD